MTPLAVGLGLSLTLLVRAAEAGAHGQAVPPNAAAQREAAAANGGAAAKAVEARASAYWALRQRRDIAAMYDFYSSLYRAKVSRDAFLAQLNGAQVELRDARVADVRVTNARAVVTIAYRMLAPTVQEQWVDSRNDEVWIREADGVWRKQEEPLALPGPGSVIQPSFPPTVTTPAFPVSVTTPAFPPDAAIPVPTSGSGDGPNTPTQPQPAPPAGR